jgi:hypothetical protein
MSDNRLLLVKCITLLYRESMIVDKADNSSDLVRTVIEGIKLPELSLSLNQDREHLMALKETALYMCSNSIDTTYEKDEILQRLKLNCNHDEKLYEALSQGIEKDMDEGSLKRTVFSIRKFINDSFREQATVDLFTKAATDLKFNRDKIKDVRNYVKEFSIKLEPYQIESNRKDPAIVGSVDIGDTSGMSEVFNEVKETDNATALLKTGWQGFNRMAEGGIRRGETITVAALPHNNKTGTTLTLFGQIAVHNDPVMINPAKKPLLLRISFEDSLMQNVQFLYQMFYENEFKAKPDFKAVTASQMAEYVKKRMESRGYHVKLMRVNPSEWTYKDIQNTVLELEANGYEIHVLALDYLTMIPTTGCESGPTGHDIKDLYKRMRNFCSARKIAMITPHQLSTEAKRMMRDGATDFVKKLPGGGYYTGSAGVDNEIDLETFIHIERLNGRAYLTFQRGKHRGINNTPDKCKYFVLPFPEDGRPILDDVNGPDTTCSKVGGGPVNSPDENPFWSFVPSADGIVTSEI